MISVVLGISEVCRFPTCVAATFSGHGGLCFPENSAVDMTS